MKYLLFLFFPLLLFGQFDPKEEEYKHYKIFVKNDTINYHVYTNKESKEINGLIFFSGFWSTTFTSNSNQN